MVSISITIDEMTDKFSPEKRSEIMSRIRGKNTKPEVIVFRYLRQQKIYFQKHYSRVLGNPDIALPRRRRAIFIDGDFWHGRTWEKRKDNLPPYWLAKIIRNIKRDRAYRSALRADGWEILRVWESEIVRKKTRDHALTAIKNFLLN